jgi:uncharacterized phage protein gp47/JayE
MFIKKSKPRLVADISKALEENTSITNFYHGSVAKTIVESISGEIEQLHMNAEEAMSSGYISRAKGIQLDYIGEMFNHKRRKENVLNSITKKTEEVLISDDVYRVEITKQIQAQTKGTQEAVYQAAMTVPGVKAATFVEKPKGPGTFSIVILTEGQDSAYSVLKNVESAVRGAAPFGSAFEIKTPLKLPFEVSIKVLFEKETSQTEQAEIKRKMKSQAIAWIESRDASRPFVYNQFVSQMISTDEKVMDVQLEKMKIDSQHLFESNYFIEADEQLVVKYINFN